MLSDIAPFRELWDGAATFVAGDDEAGYVEAIETILGDSALRGQMGDAARTRARRYLPETMAGGMLRLYLQLLAARQRGVRAA